jgi:LacI family transcriptional regulator
MSTQDDEDREREAVMSMCRRRMDGIITEPIGENHHYLQPELESGLPVVAFDRPAKGVDVDTVLSDNRGGIEAAFAHLVRHGHRRIAYIGDDERIYTGHERAEAFRACARAAGSPLQDMVQPGPIKPARIAAALRAVQHGRWPATALITGKNGTTIEVIRQLGEDFGRVALVGFDDFPLADLLRPGLTVVAQGSATIGRIAVDLLRTRATNRSGPVQTRVLPTDLIARGSGELPPA